MRKKVLSIIMLIIILITTACSTNSSYDKKEMKFNMGTNVKYYTPIYSENEFSKKEIASNKWKIQIEKMALEIVQFVNEKYSLNWKYEPLDIYFIDLNEVKIGFEIGGMYDLNEECIYLSQELENKNYDEISDTEKGFIYHEILHYLKHLNTGKVSFCFENGKKTVGHIITEGATNMILQDFFEYFNMENLKNIFRSNGYASVTLFCEQLQLIFPDFGKWYCEHNVKKFYDEFGRATNKHIEGKNIHEVFMQQMDIMYENEHLAKKQSEEGMYQYMGNFLSNMEILSAITSESKAEQFEENFRKYDKFYCGGNTYFTEETSGFMEYFSTLFYNETNE